jgi:Ala-tRNA(Pro) deacylase
MAISATLDDCLRNKGSQYEILNHPHSYTSIGTAEAAHIPGDRLAKTVLLGDEFGYVAAVLPSTYHLRLSALWKKTGRRLVLASENEMRELFKDCEVGAIPPICTA